MADLTMTVRDFQLQLLIQLIHDEQLYRETAPYLRMTDFDLSVCQLLYVALKECYQLCDNKKPSLEVLSMHTIKLANNKDGKSAAQVMPEELDILCDLLVMVHTANAKDPLKSIYLKNMLPGYMQQMRVSQAMSAHGSKIELGYGADELIQNILTINKEVATHTQFKRKFMGEVGMSFTKPKRRISSGLRSLNNVIDRGLGVSELGMITACPGVGKTNSLINFFSGAVNSGIRSLFITLELNEQRIMHRYTSIAAGIDARYFKVQPDRWPVSIQQRYAYYMNPANPQYEYASVIDVSTHRPTIDELEKIIGDWKDLFVQQYGEEKACCYGVYIDWLDYIMPTGLNVNKNYREDAILAEVTRSVGQLARKFEVALWTATQGTRAADGTEDIKMKHTAGAYHKNDALDIGLGLAASHTATSRTEAEKSVSDEALYGPDGKLVDVQAVGPACERHMHMTTTKNRDNAPGKFTFWQGYNLKYYNDKGEQDAYVEEQDKSNEAAREFAIKTIGRQKLL